MESGVLSVLQTILQYAVAPLAVVLWHMIKKIDNKVENLESRVNQTERTTDVLEAKLDDVRKDLAHIQQGIDTLLRERRI